jgi:glycosyltransferase involved in cell wall biosynthesis
MSVGLVHDYLLVMRGAERVFAAIADTWPEARIYTSLYDVEGTERRFARRDVRTSFLQRTGVKQDHFRRLMPLYPAAMARLPVRAHDVIVSSSSAFAHGIRPRPDALHVCYCHTPFRYIWHERQTAIGGLPGSLQPAADRMLGPVRRWDLAASRRVTHYVANSELTRQRIAEFYGRDATIIRPPVEIERFQRRPAEPEDWFLIVCALVRHKRVHRALLAARAAGRRVKVVGEGPERARWQAEFADVADVLGRVSDEELEDLYARAYALVVPNVEEFGITAVEAQAAGRPVLGVAAGGVLETVIPGHTGVLVELDDLADAMRDTDFTGFDPASARANAARFAPDAFHAAMRSEVDRLSRSG